MTVPQATWDAAAAALHAAGADPRGVVLLCHADPDGDALGSMSALALYLRRQGTRVYAAFGATEAGGGGATPPAIPPQYAFLPGVDLLTAPADIPRDIGLLVTLDCASPGRLGTLEGLVDRAEQVLVVDHHAQGTAFGDVRLVDPSAAATAVLVEALVAHLGGLPDSQEATCLYAGLVTDTGRFSYASSGARDHETAARLLRLGVDHAAVNQRLFQTRRLGGVRVLGKALARSVLQPPVGLVWTSVTVADLEECGASGAETDGVVDALGTVEVADVAMVCRELASEVGGVARWKVSLRSRGATDVGLVCAGLGGGGHALAAGFTAAGELDAVVAQVSAALDRSQRVGMAVG